MIVKTFTVKRGRVVDVSPAGTPPELARVRVQLWIALPSHRNGHGIRRPPARVIVAYRPADVVEVRQLPTDGS